MAESPEKTGDEETEEVIQDRLESIFHFHPRLSFCLSLVHIHPTPPLLDFNPTSIIMDPFNKLPPELRLEILTPTKSKRSIVQLIQASPVMLGQYVPHKEFIERKLFDVDAEFDDDMFNGAMAIIRFPGQGDDCLSPHDIIDHHEKLWSEGQFASTWKKERTPINNKATMIELSRLYRRLIVFVEDYLTKATAACPAREYSCLPHRGDQFDV
ncbi:hypothetical protein F5Y14DRAFT_455977 [Nemania sp. NC0429]|nr:hypothetical protein F5Y14DRAFT_455977 [Nemania sp. NC0429]